MYSRVIVWLAKKLYPSGRAYRMREPRDTGSIFTTEDGDDFITEDGGSDFVTEDSTSDGTGILFRLHRAMAASLSRVIAAALGILDVILPDNPRFTLQDAHDWYRRLGIYDSGLVAFADMKRAIQQRLSFPQVPLNKQSPAYIQAQLQAAGFNVVVRKNKFSPGPVTKTPSEILGIPVGRAYWGAFAWGTVDWGEVWSSTLPITLCVNYLEEDKDALFVIPPTDYKSTFYITDPFSITSFASIDINRKIEFRQLILKLKSASMAAILFVNYV